MFRYRRFCRGTQFQPSRYFTHTQNSFSVFFSSLYGISYTVLVVPSCKHNFTGILRGLLRSPSLLKNLESDLNWTAQMYESDRSFASKQSLVDTHVSGLIAPCPCPRIFKNVMSVSVTSFSMMSVSTPCLRIPLSLSTLPSSFIYGRPL